MADTKIFPTAEALLDCLCAALNANPNPPAECCLLVGDQTIYDVNAETGADKVCCPGLGYVRLGSMYPTGENDFPAADTSGYKQGGCAMRRWAMTLTMGTVRCVPGMGSLAGPSCVDWESAAQQQADDLQAMIAALCCFDGVLASVLGRRSAMWLPQQSGQLMQGGCIETFMPIVVDFGKCC